MATFIDEDENTSQEQEAEQFDTLNQETEEEEDLNADPDEGQTDEEDDDDDIPAKYKGKSVKDIVRMHQEAERMMGKQGSEVGELRRLVDEFIRAQTVTQHAPSLPEEEEVDFFADPDKAIARAIEKHPKVRQAEEMAETLRRTEVVNKLQNAHPDFSDIVQDAGFNEWVSKSKVRQELLARAHQQYDFDSADELLSTWKERSNVVKQAADVEKISRRQAIKSASTGSAKGSGEKASEKIYRRADIRELMQRNPERYLELAPELARAYAEGRVR